MTLDRTPARTLLARGSRKRPVAAVLLRTSLSAAAILVSTPISALGTPPQCAPVAAIEATARDHIEGWFEGDETRMERALWRGLAKRFLGTELGVTQVDMVETTALELVQQTRGKPAEPLPRTLEVVILDRIENAASVRVDAGAWIDYMHLAKIGDEWKIVNVLWERVTRDAATTEPTQ